MPSGLVVVFNNQRRDALQVRETTQPSLGDPNRTSKRNSV